MLGRGLESLPTGQMEDDAFLECEALRLVHDQRRAGYYWKQLTSMARAFLDAHLGQDGYPLRLAGIEGGAAILRRLHDNGLGETTDRLAFGIDNAHELPARTVGQSILVCDVVSEHHLAAPNQVDDRAKTIEGSTGILLRGSLLRALSVDAMHEQFLILSFVGELLAVFAADILASGAEPHGLNLEVVLLLPREVPSIEVMLAPYLVIAVVSHREVAQA